MKVWACAHVVVAILLRKDHVQSYVHTSFFNTYNEPICLIVFPTQMSYQYNIRQVETPQYSLLGNKSTFSVWHKRHYYLFLTNLCVLTLTFSSLFVSAHTCP